MLSEALVVEVRGPDGHLLTGTPVQFTAIINPGDGWPAGPYVVVSDPMTNIYNLFAGTTTDGIGRAAVRVQLGAGAGIAKVAINVPSLGISDTAQFTVLPGSPAILTRHDTVITLGATVQLNSTVTDRIGNPRSDPIIFSVSSSAVIAITPQGWVTTKAYGVQTVYLQAGIKQDSMIVSVVPSGAFAFVSPSSGTEIWVVNLDGTGLRRIVRSDGSPRYESAPVWSPDGTEILYGAPGIQTFPDPNGSMRLYRTTLTGTSRRFIANPPASLGEEAHAQYTHDGTWVYFGGHLTSTTFRLWRARPDGTDPEELGILLGNGDVDWRPSPSLDGAQLAFNAGNQRIKILNVATRTLTSFDVQGFYVQWSPTQNLLAITQDWMGPLNLVNSDGSTVRTIGTGYTGTPSWSPDGQWLLVRRVDGRLDLVQSATGQIIPLPFSMGFSEPAWKP